MTSTQRNSPCPCGSGKKYKHCCLRTSDAERAQTTHATCADEVEVDLFTVDEGGHTWPGSPTAWPASFGLVTQDVSAAELITSFFDRHTLR